MREHLPIKHPGDKLTTGYINTVGEVCNRFAGQYNISPVDGNKFQEHVFEISNTKIDETDEDDSGLYLGKKLRYVGAYDSGETENEETETSWMAESDEEWIIDDVNAELLLQIGDRVTCHWNAQRGVYLAIGIKNVSLTRHFELKTELTPGALATAYLRKWNSTTNEWETILVDDEEKEEEVVIFEVIDVLDNYRGRARDMLDSPYNRGSYGKAQFNNDSEQWEIIELEIHAALIKGRANADFDATDSTIIMKPGVLSSTIEVLHPVNGIRLDLPPTENIEVINGADISGSENDVIIAIWSDETKLWHIISGGSSSKATIGYGKPTGAMVDTDYTDPTIDLYITDSAGVHFEGDPTIVVWCNTARTALYTTYTSETIFTYVKLGESVGGVEGCIFSRTEAFFSHDTYAPSDVYIPNGTVVPKAIDTTGNEGNSAHYYVQGYMYVENVIKGQRPWFTIDPTPFYKVLTDEYDTVPGYLDEEIIVQQTTEDVWLKKSVVAEAVQKNVLKIEHKLWDVAKATVTQSTLAEILDTGGGHLSTTGSEPTDTYDWIEVGLWVNGYDVCGHSDMVVAEGQNPTYIQWTSVPLGVTANDILRWDGTKWVVLTAPSSSGNFVLMCNDGVMEWEEVQEFECPPE